MGLPFSVVLTIVFTHLCLIHYWTSREGIQKVVPIQETTKLAIDYCINNGILNEFKKKERDAVMSNIVYEYEYDEQETLAYIAEEQYGLGHSEGHAESRIELIRTKVLKSKSLETIADELECEVEDIRDLYDVVMQCEATSNEVEIEKR